MPKSKRNKIVHLTQVRKKGKDHKVDLIKQLEELVAKFERVFIFDFDTVKSDRIMNLRLKLKDVGKIFAGRNSLATVTLKTIGSRTNTNFEELAEQIVGHKGLLFTDLDRDKLVELLDKENLTEFLKKLIGYAKIAPDTVSMDLDGGDKNDNAGAKADSATKTKKPKNKKSKQKATDVEVQKATTVTKPSRRQVKFVKM